MTRPTKAERELAAAYAALERSRKRLVTSALIIAREMVDGALTDYGLMEFDRLRDAARSVEHFTHRIGVLRRAITRERKKAVGRLGAVGRPGSPGAGAAVTADWFGRVVADQAERNGLSARDVLRAVARAMGARELQDGDALLPGQLHFEVPRDR